MNKILVRKLISIVIGLSLCLSLITLAYADKDTDSDSNLLNPESIPKFVNQLAIPPAYTPKISTDSVTGKKTHTYEIQTSAFYEQILPQGFPKTFVWGYGGMVTDAATGKSVYSESSPGATIEAIRGIPVKVKWKNSLTGNHIFPVDPTICWANPNNMEHIHKNPLPQFPELFSMAQSNIPTAPHLHGGETSSTSDGHPQAWFTSSGSVGPTYTSSEYDYPNAQNPTTLWYHDHALGITRTNVYSGLAGFYLLRDINNPLDNPNTSVLPKGQYEIPVVVQDRIFNKDGSLNFPSVGVNPSIHPYWTPEFFGDTIMVNGKVWPNLNVERRQYRFRLLNGSNARFYNFSLSNKQEIIQIGSDGGFLKAPVKTSSILLAPGERADVLIDFSALSPNTKVQLLNDARTPYPDGDKVDPDTTGKIMQFTVNAIGKVTLPNKLPTILNTIPTLTPTTAKRTLTLTEVMAEDGPEEVLLNGQKFTDAATELPMVGSTEDWEIVNLTEDAHPIHLHLVQFQLVNRQKFNAKKYETDWMMLNGMPPLNKKPEVIPVDKYLIGKATGRIPVEEGWKDTIRVNPGEITTIRIRLAPQDADAALVKPGVNLFPFDPTVGPGYVWHCHILDHEDNEMMRPLKIVK